MSLASELKNFVSVNPNDLTEDPGILVVSCPQKGMPGEERYKIIAIKNCENIKKVINFRLSFCI